MSERNKILIGDCLERMREVPSGCAQTCVTSPPYYCLRDYKADGQIGQEETPSLFVSRLVEVFREVRRLLRDDGTLWLNLGDSYARNGGTQGGGNRELLHLEGKQKRMGRIPTASGLKEKDLIGIPWMVAFALREDGWYLRQRMPWVKRNAMPESTRDRPGTAVEDVFLLSKSKNYFYDYDAVLQTMAESSGPRLNQDIENQAGFTRANGGAKTNGAMKAVRGDKQRGHSRRHDGFNDRWDAMTKDEQCGQRSYRNSDMFFESLTYPHGAIGSDSEIIGFDTPTSGYREAHFATFPPSLIIPMILAGTSERGCCATCGAAVRRLVERGQVTRERPNEYVKRIGEDGTGNSCANTVAGVSSKTIGWEPGCKCGAANVPCLVLDPFGGSGTTAQVAKHLGRDWLITELNPDYAALAEKRIAEPLRLKGDKRPKPLVLSPGQLDLFDKETA